MLGIVTGIIYNKVFIWNKELGYEEAFFEDEFQFLKHFGLITGEEILTEHARETLRGKVPSRYAPDGTLLYKYCSKEEKTFICASKLGPFCLHGDGNVVFTENVQEIHDSALLSLDFNGEIDICCVGHRLKSKLYRLASAAALTIVDEADKCDLYSLEASLYNMEREQLDPDQDRVLVEWNLSAVQKLGKCGIDWLPDYDLGEWSPNNERMMYFIQCEVAHTINISDAYKFAVGYYRSLGRDPRIGQLLYNYLFG